MRIRKAIVPVSSSYVMIDADQWTELELWMLLDFEKLLFDDELNENWARVRKAKNRGLVALKFCMD